MVFIKITTVTLFFSYRIEYYLWWIEGFPTLFLGAHREISGKIFLIFLKISHFSQNFSNFSKFLKFLKFLRISQNFSEFLKFLKDCTSRKRVGNPSEISQRLHIEKKSGNRCCPKSLHLNFNIPRLEKSHMIAYDLIHSRVKLLILTISSTYTPLTVSVPFKRV